MPVLRGDKCTGMSAKSIISTLKPYKDSGVGSKFKIYYRRSYLLNIYRHCRLHWHVLALYCSVEGEGHESMRWVCSALYIGSKSLSKKSVGHTLHCEFMWLTRGVIHSNCCRKERVICRGL